MAAFSCFLVGNEPLTVECGKHILEAGHRIAVVATSDAAVAAWAKEAGLEVLEGAKALSEGSETVDWLFSVANLEMIPGPVLTRATKGAVNFHDGPLPAYAGLAIFFGLGANASLRVAVARRRPLAALAIYVLCLIQFAMLAYDPRKQIPDERDRSAGERLVETIRSFEGEVLVVSHGYLAGLAGKRRSAQWMAIADILRAGEGAVKDDIQNEITGAIRERRFAAIIVDRDWHQEDLEAHYELRGSAFNDASVFWTRTGLRTRPERIYVPKRADTP